MCWNATASLTAFISGIFTCIIVSMIAYKQKKYELMALSIGWLWVVSMQLWEYFLWKNQFPTENNIFYSNMAYVFNVTQVLLLGLIFLTFFENQGLLNRSVVALILFGYVCYILYFGPSLGTMSVSSSCANPHLEYPWWTKIPMGGIIYIVILILIFLLIVRPFEWSLKTISVIMILFFLSWTFYSKSVASMWCFFAVLTPIISLLLS
jgi:hypothetical protein